MCIRDRYYTGLDPRTMKPIYVARDPHEKAMQRALIQYRDPKNYELVTEALIRANRRDLVGTGPKCLLRPRHGDTRFLQKTPAAQKHAEKRRSVPVSRRWEGPASGRGAKGKKRR